MPFDIGPGELILILIIALIVFGPAKLPELGRQVGGAVREFRRISSAATAEMTRALDIESPPASGTQSSSASAIEDSAAPAIESPAEPIQFRSFVADETDLDGDVATPNGESPVPSLDSATPLEATATVYDAAPGLVFCLKCKAGTAAANNFCGVCGAPLRPPMPVVVGEDQPESTEPDTREMSQEEQPAEQPQSNEPLRVEVGEERQPQSAEPPAATAEGQLHSAEPPAATAEGQPHSAEPPAPQIVGKEQPRASERL